MSREQQQRLERARAAYHAELDRATESHIQTLIQLCAHCDEPEPDEAAIRAALDFGKTAEQHLVGGRE